MLPCFSSARGRYFFARGENLCRAAVVVVVAIMRHRKTLRNLGRPSAHRWAMLRNMVTQLIKHERIKTTLQKAKELRRVADKMVTLAKVRRPSLSLALVCARACVCARAQPAPACFRAFRVRAISL